MGFAHDNVILAIVLELLTYAKVYMVAHFDISTVWTSGNNDAGFGFLTWRDDEKLVFLDIGFDDEAVLVGSQCHFFFGADLGAAAARFTEYAMATACFTGLPALTSARTLLLKAFSLVDFFNGMFNSPSKMMKRHRLHRLGARFASDCSSEMQLGKRM